MQWTRFNSVNSFAKSYATWQAASKVRCGAWGVCNPFEIEANPFAGGYWQPNTVVNGQIQMDPSNPSLSTVGDIMDQYHARGYR